MTREYPNPHEQVTLLADRTARRLRAQRHRRRAQWLVVKVGEDVVEGLVVIEQLLRDAIFSRTTSHISEIRVLKKAFVAFDTD